MAHLDDCKVSMETLLKSTSMRELTEQEVIANLKPTPDEVALHPLHPPYNMSEKVSKNLVAFLLSKEV